MKQLLNTFLYIPRHDKLTDKNLLHLLIASAVGIILCAACMAGMAFAWFSTELPIKDQTIAAANFDVTVSISDALGNPVSPAADRSYTLIGGQEYTVTLTPAGTATAGYCIMTTASDAQQQIIPLTAGEDYQLQLTPAEDEQYSFVAMWGTPEAIGN